MSDKDINGLIAMYRQNGTLNAETPIEVEKHYSTDLMGAMQAVFDKITGNGTEVVDRQG